MRAPNVQVLLPRKFLQPSSTGSSEDTKEGFYAMLYSTDRLVSSASSWFDVWAAVISTNALCMSEGKAGNATLQGKLRVKVDRIYRPPSGLTIGGSVGNATVSLVASN